MSRRCRAAKGQLDLFDEPAAQLDLFAWRHRFEVRAVKGWAIARSKLDPSEAMHCELLARAFDRVAKEEPDPIEAALLEASAQRLRGRKLQ